MASTLTVIVVFAPLVFLSGVTGVFFRALAVTLGGGLAISLLLALYFTPALELLARAPMRRRSRASGGVFRAGRSALHFQSPAIPPDARARDRRGGGFTWRGLRAVPHGRYRLSAGNSTRALSFSTTDAAAKHARRHRGIARDQIQTMLKATPEVAAFSRRTGTQLGFFLTESNRGDISVRLKRESQPRYRRDHRLGTAANPRHRTRSATSSSHRCCRTCSAICRAHRSRSR